MRDLSSTKVNNKLTQVNIADMRLRYFEISHQIQSRCVRCGGIGSKIESEVSNYFKKSRAILLF